tara:strand:+ start:900 stop:1304 length:405 start_codon:yes stop_codon:yes gene_type:complete
MIKYSEEEVKDSDGGDVYVPKEEFEEGSYYCEVKEVRDGKRAKQYGICYKEVESGDIICWDNLTFDGKALGIAHKKILMLDPEFKVGEEYDEQNLVGKRVNLLLENETFNGRTSLRPKFKSENFGYTAEADVPF